MTEYRCPKCGKLLVEGTFVGTIIAHCVRCKRKITFTQ